MATTTHPACGKTWTGLRREHCTACCETFNSPKAGNAHRRGEFGVDRHCAPPASVGLVGVEQADGTLIWQTSGEDPRRA